MEIDDRLRPGNVLYIIDEEGCELYERVDRIEGGLLITSNSSWYLNTLGSTWHIKEVVRSTQQPVQNTEEILSQDILKLDAPAQRRRG